LFNYHNLFFFLKNFFSLYFFNYHNLFFKKLSEKHSKHDDYLKIQLENSNNYLEAIDYIKKLGDEESVENLKKYGKLIMKHAPDKTIELLKIICSKVNRTTI